MGLDEHGSSADRPNGVSNTRRAELFTYTIGLADSLKIGP